MENKTETLEQRLTIRQDWIELERGWGTRPDGCSLHKTIEDCRAYISHYWDSMPDSVPNEYERPAGEPYNISVPKELYDEMAESDCGMRLYCGSMHRLKNENQEKHR
ncbi:MAG: hypothetical protein U9R34_02825 [Nanoarchaeota archaeon]|nr:hypothetical protein [Nanoarchaeota archaeon]